MVKFGFKSSKFKSGLLNSPGLLFILTLMVLNLLFYFFTTNRSMERNYIFLVWLLSLIALLLWCLSLAIWCERVRNFAFLLCFFVDAVIGGVLGVSGAVIMTDSSIRPSDATLVVTIDTFVLWIQAVVNSLSLLVYLVFPQYLKRVSGRPLESNVFQSIRRAEEEGLFSRKVVPMSVRSESEEIG